MRSRYKQTGLQSTVSLSTAMAPSRPRRANSNNQDVDATHDNDNIPTWNTATSKLSAFVAKLEQDDALYNSINHSLSLFTRGWYIDSRGRKVVQSYKHIKWIIDNPDKLYTFAEPSPVDLHKETATELRDTKIRIGIITVKPRNTGVF